MSVTKILKKNIRSGVKWFYTNRIRKSVREVGKDLHVNKKSSATANTFLGNNVNFNGMTISGKGNVTIGDNFHSGEDCLMLTQIHNYDNGQAIPYDDTYIIKDIIVKDNVWLGNRVIVLGGVTIEEGAVIQAGSVVVNDIPKYGIAGGHPAKVFKNRDINHYKKLKKELKFH